MVWGLLLTPSLPTPAGLPSIRVDDVLLVLAPLFVAGAMSRVILDRRVLVILLIAVSIELGIFAGAALGYPASALDHFIWVRLAKYVGAIVLASALLDTEGSTDRALAWLIRTSCWAGVVLVLISVQQYFNIFELNRLYVEFVAPTQYETLVGGYLWPRPVGMVGNPNELSFIFGILALSAMWMLFKHGSHRRVWCFLALIFFAAAVLTLSRSGVFATFGAMGVLIGSEIGQRIRLSKRSGIIMKRRVIHVTIGISGLTVLLAALIALSDTLYQEVVWRFMPGNYGSFFERIERWQENIQLWEASPILGVGTLSHSNVLQYAADNEWLLLARTGGVVLVGLVLSLFSMGLFRHGLSSDGKHFACALIVGACLYMIPAAFFYSLVIMPLALMLLTVAAPSSWRVVTLHSHAAGMSGGMFHATGVRRQTC